MSVSNNSIDNQITANNFSIDAGNLNIPVTNSSGTQGVINSGGTRLMHIAGGISNIFIGVPSGNFSLTGTNNVGIGRATLQNITSASENTAVGLAALQALQTGTLNMGIGYFALGNLTSGTGSNMAIGGNALINITTGSNNTAIGTNAGMNCTTTDSNNIFINNNGTAGDNNITRIGSSQTKCFVAGINGVTVSGSTVPVVVNSSGQLGVGAVLTQQNFQAFVTTTLSGVTGNGTTYIPLMQSTYFDTASGYSSLTGKYTVPSTGVWMFGGTFSLDGIVSSNTQGIVVVNGSTASIGSFTPIINNPSVAQLGAAHTTYTFQWSTIMQVNASDTIYPSINISTNATPNINLVGSTSGGFTSFWGYRIA